jgi:hypothetical protein
VKELQMEDPFEPEKKLNYSNVLILIFGLIIIGLIVFIIYGYGQLPKKDNFLETLIGTSTNNDNDTSDGDDNSNQEESVATGTPEAAWTALSSDDYMIEGTGEIEITNETETGSSSISYDYNDHILYYQGGSKVRIDSKSGADLPYIAQPDGSIVAIDETKNEYYVLYTTGDEDQELFYTLFYSDPLHLIFDGIRDASSEYTEVDTNIWETTMKFADPLSETGFYEEELFVRVVLDATNDLIVTLQAFNSSRAPLGRIDFLYEEVENIEELVQIPVNYTEGSLY